jgi:16S rRNA (uracil1498-N3)-methyltransferase
LDRTESHHARNVLRLSAGESIELFDGAGGVAIAQIDRYESNRALCRITDFRVDPPITPQLVVASAVPKGPRADAMVDQLSQLGVDRFISLHTEHSVAVPKPAKVEKFARAAVESAKQCERSWLMQIDPPGRPTSVWKDAAFDLKLIAAPGGEPLPDLADRMRSCRSVLVLIGPEGGWSDGELKSAADAGCLRWTIAPHILRIETAATTAASILRYMCHTH